MSLPPLGLSCIVLGETYSIESPAVLDRVAGLGFKGVEADVEDPKGFKKMLDDRGMSMACKHVCLPALRETAPLLDLLGTLDCRDVCNSGLMDWGGTTEKEFAEAADLLNRSGTELRRHGVMLHYHNHDFELKPLSDGRTGMDVLLANLDPAACDLCVDVGWLTYMSVDPVAYLRAHRDRITYLHFKDVDAANDWIELGQGRTDFTGVMALLPGLSGVRWVSLEQDATKLDPLESIAISRSYFKDTFRY